MTASFIVTRRTENVSIGPDLTLPAWANGQNSRKVQSVESTTSIDNSLCSTEHFYSKPETPLPRLAHYQKEFIMTYDPAECMVFALTGMTSKERKSVRAKAIKFPLKVSKCVWEILLAIFLWEAAFSPNLHIHLTNRSISSRSLCMYWSALTIKMWLLGTPTEPLLPSSTRRHSSLEYFQRFSSRQSLQAFRGR